MKKGASHIFLAILILMIGISLVALLAVILPNIAFEAYPEEAYNKTYLRSRACLGLENVDWEAQTLTLKNCGLISLTDFNLFVDYEEVGNLNLDKLDPTESATVNYDISLSSGSHYFYVTADYAETPFITVEV